MTDIAFIDALQQAAMVSQQNEYQALESLECPQTGIVLTEEEVSSLANRILAFPRELRDCLFAHYYFGLNVNNTAHLFNIEATAGKLNYARRLLSLAMNINGTIDNTSIKMAVETAVEQYTNYDEYLQVIPRYSNRFRRKLREIQAVQSTHSLFNRIMHRVAVILLVCAIGFSTALVVDADLRKDFFNWLIETFPAFSIFHKDKDSDGERSPYDLSFDDIEIGYLPIGYKLDYYDNYAFKLTFYFSSSHSNKIIVSFSTNTPLYANTEDIVVHNVKIKGTQSYWWERNSRTHLIWEQDGFSCHIEGEISSTEAIKIAENIEIRTI